MKALFPQCTVASTWHERLLSKSLDSGEPGRYGVDIRRTHLREELMNVPKKTQGSPRPTVPGAMPEGNELRRRIAERAYGLYVARDRAPGHDLEDWLEAERLVREELAVTVRRSPGRQRTTLSH
jgi:hypothetical protein